MIDMGTVHGGHVFYTNGRSIRELMEAGELVAIPDATQGIIYKRTCNATPLELAAQLTVEEAKIREAAWNSMIDELEGKS